MVLIQLCKKLNIFPGMAYKAIYYNENLQREVNYSDESSAKNWHSASINQPQIWRY